LLGRIFGRGCVIGVPERCVSLINDGAILRTCSPFDSESSDSWLLSKHVPSDTLNDRLGGRLRIKLLRIIFVVDVVANSYELSPIITACQEDDSDPKYLGSGDSFEVRRVSFEDELVHADRNGSDKKRVKLLVMLRPANTMLEIL